MDPALAPRPETALRTEDYPEIVCRYCGHQGCRMEVHMELVDKPVGTWSLAGAQPKTVVEERPWYFLRCLGCNHVSRGQVPEPETPGGQ